MGGYACSSWYFLRFADPGNDAAFASRPALDYWLPVDLYTGGIEHARSHLLYARFWTKVLFDEGLLGFEEPFLHPAQPGLAAGHDPRAPAAAPGSRTAAGDEKIIDWIVLKHDEREQFPADQVVWRWARMSKSKGNVVTPDDITERYGADSLRVYEMFVAPFEDDVQWSEEGIQGSHRFVTRVWRWLQAALPLYRRDWRECPARATMTPEERARAPQAAPDGAEGGGADRDLPVQHGRGRHHGAAERDLRLCAAGEGSAGRETSTRPSFPSWPRP